MESSQVCFSEATTIEGVSCRLARIGIWQFLVSSDNEPRIVDLELAERLGYDRPRKIRDLIKRLMDAGELSNIQQRPTMVRYEIRPGVWHEQVAIEYLLTQADALFVAARSETKVGSAILREMATAYLAVLKGLLTPSVPQAHSGLAEIKEVAADLRQSSEAFALAAQQAVSTARFGDNADMCIELSKLIRLGATAQNVTWQAIHGDLCKNFKVVSYKQILQCHIDYIKHKLLAYALKNIVFSRAVKKLSPKAEKRARKEADMAARQTLLFAPEFLKYSN